MINYLRRGWESAPDNSEVLARNLAAAVSPSRTSSHSLSATHTVSKTPSHSKTMTKTPSSTKTMTKTPSLTKTATKSVSSSPSESETPSPSESVSESMSVTVSATSSISHTSSTTPSCSISLTKTASVSLSASHTVSSSLTASATPSISVTPSAMPSPIVECNIGVKWYAWAAGMYTKCAQVTSHHQINAFKTGMVTEDEALTITNAAQVVALEEGISYDLAINVVNFYNVPALHCCVDNGRLDLVQSAYFASNYGQQVAVCYNTVALPNDIIITDDQISQITLEPQVRAFVISNNLSYLTPLTFEEALEFTNLLQVNLYMQGESLVDLLKITNIVAYGCLLQGMSVDDASQCYIWFQLAAYKCCFNAEEALAITNYGMLEEYSCPGAVAPCTSFF